jgi:hypothetical protein
MRLQTISPPAGIPSISPRTAVTRWLTGFTRPCDERNPRPDGHLGFGLPLDRVDLRVPLVGVRRIGGVSRRDLNRAIDHNVDHDIDDHLLAASVGCSVTGWPLPGRSARRRPAATDGRPTGRCRSRGVLLTRLLVGGAYGRPRRPMSRPRGDSSMNWPATMLRPSPGSRMSNKRPTQVGAAGHRRSMRRPMPVAARGRRTSGELRTATRHPR